MYLYNELGLLSSRSLRIKEVKLKIALNTFRICDGSSQRPWVEMG